MKPISLIIPVRNAEKKLVKRLEILISKVKIPRGARLAEVIFVDDGSTDNTFLSLTNLIENSFIPISILSYKRRRGKKAAEEAQKYIKHKNSITINYEKIA